jgi:hypothetical protein
MVNRKRANKIMIDNDNFYGMGEYADSYQGGMINPFSERSVPRSPSQALLTTKYDLAANRSSEVNGGFVHRPVRYRGVGAGMYNDEVEGGKFGLTKQQGDAFFQGTKYVTQPVKALGAIASMTPLAPYALPITVGMTAYEQLVKSLSGNGMNNYEGAVGYGEPFKNKPRMNKRAMIVKKVMNERGVSMIEASKIVKNEGLY